MKAIIFFTGFRDEIKYDLSLDADVAPQSVTFKDGKELIFKTNDYAKIDELKTSKDYKEAFVVNIEEKSLSIAFKKKEPGDIHMTDINVDNNLLIFTAQTVLR